MELKATLYVRRPDTYRLARYRSAANASLPSHLYTTMRGSTPYSDSESSDSDSSSSIPSPPSSISADCNCCPPPDTPLAPSPTRPTPPLIPTIDPSHFHSILIIGAGPHALAVAARLRERRPAALFTDLEHARLSWLHTTSHPKRITVKGHWSARKLVPTRAAPLMAGDDVKVLDATAGTWMGRWDAYFAGLGIAHLRSPMFFHPSPADSDALVAFARREGREGELVGIEGVVGKEKSKHARKQEVRRKIGGDALINERSREDYFRPSAPLFRSFCETDVVERYELAGLVEQATVTSVSYGPLDVEGDDQVDGFVVDSTLPDGTTVRRAAKAIVIAIGPHSSPNVPQVIQDAVGDTAAMEGDGWCHSSAFPKPHFRFPSATLRTAILAKKLTTMVVIGGGLTSAQICDLAVARGVSRVVLITRGHVKVRHFDFGLEWVSKFANLEKMAFWQEDAREERLRIVREARGGGSVNPAFHAVLKRLEQRGILDLRTFSTVTSATWDPARRKWALVLSSFRPDPIADAKLAAPREQTRTELADVDYVVCSTGSAMSFDQLPFLAPLRASHPIEVIGGYPNVTKDLQWGDELPAFVVGAYAMLELGPDGANLSGTRHGAERVVSSLSKIDGVFPEERDVEDGGWGSRRKEKEVRSGGVGGYFSGLEESCE